MEEEFEHSSSYRRWLQAKRIAWLLVSGQAFRRPAQVPLALGEGRRESPKNSLFRRLVETVQPAVSEENETNEEIQQYKNLEELQNRVVSQDEHIVCIHDHKPAAQVHLLILPRQPLLSVLSLRATEEDIALLKHMIEQGKKALHEAGYPDDKTWRLGFHVPPLTSVDHLHLHCLAGKLSGRGKLKFDLNFHHFVPAQQVLDRLSNNQQSRL